jgi:hypothetical protein
MSELLIEQAIIKAMELAKQNNIEVAIKIYKLVLK